MKALLVVDVQYDFLPGGALAVPDGDKIIPVVNELISRFDFIVATQDWHPADHKSFASNHEGKKVGDIIKLNDLDQYLWPDHCIQGTHGAEYSHKVNMAAFKKVFVKGTDPEIDSYSGFYDNGHKKSTGLSAYLKGQGVDEVYICGLAADYCVEFTAMDAIREGFETSVFKDGTRAVNVNPGDFDKAMKDMGKAGIKIIDSQDI